MPKTITCDIKPFVGKVTFYDPLTMPMVIAVDDAVLNRRDFFDEITNDDGQRLYTLKEQTAWSAPDREALKGILPCVESWNLAGFPESVTIENFPGSPRGASKNLISWLLNQVLEIYRGEIEIPNE